MKEKKRFYVVAPLADAGIAVQAMRFLPRALRLLDEVVASATGFAEATPVKSGASTISGPEKLTFIHVN